VDQKGGVRVKKEFRRRWGRGSGGKNWGIQGGGDLL